MISMGTFLFLAGKVPWTLWWTRSFTRNWTLLRHKVMRSSSVCKQFLLKQAHLSKASHSSLILVVSNSAWCYAKLQELPILRCISSPSQSHCWTLCTSSKHLHTTPFITRYYQFLPWPFHCLKAPLAVHVPVAPNDAGLTVGALWAFEPPMRPQALQCLGSRGTISHGNINQTTAGKKGSKKYLNRRVLSRSWDVLYLYIVFPCISCILRYLESAANSFSLRNARISERQQSNSYIHRVFFAFDTHTTRIRRAFWGTRASGFLTKTFWIQKLKNEAHSASRRWVVWILPRSLGKSLKGFLFDPREKLLYIEYWRFQTQDLERNFMDIPYFGNRLLQIC